MKKVEETRRTKEMWFQPAGAGAALTYQQQALSSELGHFRVGDFGAWGLKLRNFTSKGGVLVGPSFFLRARLPPPLCWLECDVRGRGNVDRGWIAPALRSTGWPQCRPEALSIFFELTLTFVKSKSRFTLLGGKNKWCSGALSRSLRGRPGLRGGVTPSRQTSGPSHGRRDKQKAVNCLFNIAHAANF